MATCKERYKQGLIDKTEYKKCKIKTRGELSKLRQENKNNKKISKARTAAKKDEILRGKKIAQSERYRENVKATRTRTQVGDGRRKGDNVKINKTKIDNRQTHTTAMGGAGGKGGKAKGGKAGAGASATGGSSRAGAGSSSGAIGKIGKKKIKVGKRKTTIKNTDKSKKNTNVRISSPLAPSPKPRSRYSPRRIQY